MNFGDFIFKMIDQHPFWLVWFTLIPIICCACFGVAAAEASYEDCDSEKCVNFRKEASKHED